MAADTAAAALLWCSSFGLDGVLREVAGREHL